VYFPVHYYTTYNKAIILYTQKSVKSTLNKNAKLRTEYNKSG